MAIYIGLDCGTQTFKAVAIRVTPEGREVVYEDRLDYDEAFPAYGTKDGVLPPDEKEPAERRAPPLMWAEALDRMMERLAKQGGFPLDEVRAISGSAQQHGSVYLNAEAERVLASLDPARPLRDQLEGIFSRRNSPIWMDSSTTEQCEEITEAIGGETVIANLTGSPATERFTGPQIRKFYQEDPEGYESTAKIHLVSSFMCSLLAGRHAPIDPADGSGMNLMDLARRRWAASALQVTAPNLGEKLPEIQESWTVAGPLARYWVERYGFPASARAVLWSGDNPCSLVGVGIVETGWIAISLGTSDTLFGLMPKPHIDPAGYGHTFASPTGEYMSLICFKNGSLARERIRDEYGLDWEGFARALEETPPGNLGRVLLPWFEPEITPKVLEPGVRRYGLDPKDGPANVRALVEGQMLAMAIHSQWMKVKPTRIHATGGASENRAILQVMADVHGAEVLQFQVKDSAALGAALRAFHADELAEGRRLSWRDVIQGFVEPLPGGGARPVPERIELYAELRKVYKACEDHAIRGGEDPTPLIEAFRKRFGG